MHCSNCANGDCGYSVSYTEGSSIRGRMVEDDVFFSSESGRAKVRASFGCQTYETGLFNKQVADGIIGFSRSRSYGPTLIDRVHSQLGAPDVFSLCLSDTTGAMVLGGRLDGGAAEPQWVRTSPGAASYEVAVEQFLVDGAAAPGSSSQYRGTIVDSGTTFTYLPPSAYAKAKERWRSPPGGCPWGECSKRAAKGEYPDDYCYTMTEEEMAKFAENAFVFAGGVKLRLPPSQYGYELRDGVRCMGIFNNEHSGAVIGGATIRDHEVIFDREQHRVAFVPSDCDAMYAGRRKSALKGGTASPAARPRWLRAAAEPAEPAAVAAAAAGPAVSAAAAVAAAVAALAAVAARVPARPARDAAAADARGGRPPRPTGCTTIACGASSASSAPSPSPRSAASAAQPLRAPRARGAAAERAAAGAERRPRLPEGRADDAAALRPPPARPHRRLRARRQRRADDESFDLIVRGEGLAGRRAAATLPGAHPAMSVPEEAEAARAAHLAPANCCATPRRSTSSRSAAARSRSARLTSSTTTTTTSSRSWREVVVRVRIFSGVKRVACSARAPELRHVTSR